MLKKIEFTDIKNKQTPAFGSSPVDLLVKGFQACEKHPMVNVSVLDLTSAIGPRYFAETYSGSKKTDENGKTYRDPNYYAGFEALRRESSGLIVNCLIPSVAALGIAHLFKKPVMGLFNKSNPSNTWAGTDFLKKVHSYYSEAKSSDKIYETFKNMLSDIEGVNGKDPKPFKDLVQNDAKFGKKLKDLADSISNGKYDKNLVKEVRTHIISKTGVGESIKFAGDKSFCSGNLDSVLTDTTKVLKGVVQEGITDAGKLKDYFKRAGKLVKFKSIGGLALIIPLAISMQPINRWITRKTSGRKGAPIHSDFKEREHKELTRAEKSDLLKQKFISIGSMIGVAWLSMGLKVPSLKMFEFKGLFPTMDQARLISTATFSSRMGASEDADDLREATIRDIATFSSFYFLGDYAAKGIATAMERNNPNVKLLNTLKPLKKNANLWDKFVHWVKDTSLKSSDEAASIVTNSAENVTKNNKLVNNKNLRTLCQLGNLGFSLLILGVLIPTYTRTQTNKKDKARIAAEKAGVNVQTEPPQPGKTSFSASYKSVMKGSKAFNGFFNS